MDVAARAGDGRRMAFLAGLEQGLSVTGAAAAAGISRGLAYKWRERSDFAAAWRLAAEAGTDRLEDEALRRALEGVEKPVFYRGQQVGSVRTYNDRLLMLLLQRRCPVAGPDEEARRQNARESEASAGKFVKALAACDRRIAELTHQLNEARRNLAAATPGTAVPEPLPVVLPYDEADLFDAKALNEAKAEGGAETGSTDRTGSPDSTPVVAPAVPEPVALRLPVSRCLPVSKCLPAGTSPPGRPDRQPGDILAAAGGTRRPDDLRGILAHLLAYTSPGQGRQTQARIQPGVKAGPAITASAGSAATARG